MASTPLGTSVSRPLKNVLADKDFLRAVTSPSQKLNPAYGYLWWLNGGPFLLRGAGTRKTGRLLPTGPRRGG